MRELAAVQGEMTRLQAELKALNDAMHGSAADMKANHLTGPIDVAFLAAHRRYTVAMQRKGQSLVQDMARQQRKVDEAHAARRGGEGAEGDREAAGEAPGAVEGGGGAGQAEADEVGAQFGYRQVAGRTEPDQYDPQAEGHGA